MTNIAKLVKDTDELVAAANALMDRVEAEQITVEAKIEAIYNSDIPVSERREELRELHDERQMLNRLEWSIKTAGQGR